MGICLFQPRDFEYAKMMFDNPWYFFLHSIPCGCNSVMCIPVRVQFRGFNPVGSILWVQSLWVQSRAGSILWVQSFWVQSRGFQDILLQKLLFLFILFDCSVQTNNSNWKRVFFYQKWRVKNVKFLLHCLIPEITGLIVNTAQENTNNLLLL